MSTRCDPVEDIDFIRHAWSGPLDPRLPKGVRTNSRAIIDACRPFSWIDEFPPVARSSEALRLKIREKFKDAIPVSVDVVCDSLLSCKAVYPHYPRCKI